MNEAKPDARATGSGAATMDEIELGFLLADVRRYLDNLYPELAQASALRRGGVELDERETYLFFRSKERADTLKVLLQYLSAFSANPPRDDGERDEEGRRAYWQFHDFCRAYVGLLGEDDVRAAVGRELSRQGAPPAQVAPAIDEECAQLAGLLAQAGRSGHGEYGVLFQALRRYCLFWFGLRGFRFERARRSDFFVYALARLQLEARRGAARPPVPA